MSAAQYTLATVKAFDAPATKQCDKLYIFISLEWRYCFKGWVPSKNVPSDEVAGSCPCFGQTVYSHEAFIKALCDLVSACEFKELTEICILVGDTLQRFNLVVARGQSINDNAAMLQAADDLLSLGKQWQQKYAPIIENMLPWKTIRYLSWNDIVCQDWFHEKQELFKRTCIENVTVKSCL